MATNYPTSLETRPALPTGVAVPRASEASIAELLPFLHPANTAVCVRHTGVAATQTGKAHVEIDYTID